MTEFPEILRAEKAERLVSALGVKSSKGREERMLKPRECVSIAGDNTESCRENGVRAGGATIKERLANGPKTHRSANRFRMDTAFR